MKFYTEEKEKVLTDLGSGVDGISNEEAASRLEKNGKNKLEYAVFGRERRRKKNGYRINKAGDMIGNFKAVLFCPDDLDLVKGGPEERREFLNVAIAQCYPHYVSVYYNYKKALENRNALLKNASKGLYFDESELIKR